MLLPIPAKMGQNTTYLLSSSNEKESCLSEKDLSRARRFFQFRCARDVLLERGGRCCSHPAFEILQSKSDADSNEYPFSILPNGVCSHELTTEAGASSVLSRFAGPSTFCCFGFAVSTGVSTGGGVCLTEEGIVVFTASFIGTSAFTISFAGTSALTVSFKGTSAFTTSEAGGAVATDCERKEADEGSYTIFGFPKDTEDGMVYEGREITSLGERVGTVDTMGTDVSLADSIFNRFLVSAEMSLQ